MGLFGSKEDLTSYNLDQFVEFARKDPSYADFKREYEAVGGSPIVGMTFLFETQLRKMGLTKRWSYSNSPDLQTPSLADMVLHVPGKEKDAFGIVISECMKSDARLAHGRVDYIASLKAKAQSGELTTKLNNETEPEGNYYHAPAPRRAAVGAPPIPPLPGVIIEKRKGLAWAIGNPLATEDVKSTYVLAQQLCEPVGGQFPIRDFTVLYAIWRKLVPGAPVLRAPNLAGGVKYPSSYTGEAVLKHTLRDMKSIAVPAAGNDRWYDWALYVFAAIMTSQAFSDGNKRTARFAYITMLRAGQVPFKAPTARLGSELAQMQ